MGWFALTALVALAPACAGKHEPLDAFVEKQHVRMQEKSVYVDAELEFWAAVYEPTLDDIQSLRDAWIGHGQAFPESKPVMEVERQIRATGEKALLVSLFMPSYENADLNSKSLGWAVYPIPVRITELSENDVVLRTLMPVRNPWARYFLLRYQPEVLASSNEIIVSDRKARVEFARKRY